MTPVRIHRRRTKGWRMPENTVSVTRPGVFGNPFTLKAAHEVGYKTYDACNAVRDFRAWLDGSREVWTGPESEKKHAALMKRLPELRGKNLACWCPLDQPCHADVLIELANPQAALTLPPLPKRKVNVSPAFDAALARAPRSGWNRKR